MQRPSMDRSSFSALKYILILIAIGVWAFVSYGIYTLLLSDSGTRIYYGLGTVLAVVAVYILILFLELLIDIKDLD